LIDPSSIELTNSAHILGNEGNESDQSPYARWIGRIMAIRASAKDKVFMYVFRLLHSDRRAAMRCGEDEGEI
jgi:hypothetical protein